MGESPAEEEVKQGRPFVGRAGKVLNSLLEGAGLNRADCRLVNLVPVRAPKDHYADHTDEDKAWGLALLRQELDRAIAAGAKIIVPLGENPLNAIIPGLPHPPRWTGDGERSAEKKGGRIGAWRGSLLPYGVSVRTLADYEAICRPFHGVAVLPTYHPAAVARLYPLHLLSLVDFGKVKTWIEGRWEFPLPREWVFQDIARFEAFVERVITKGHLIALDTEMNPPIVAICDEQEVHVWQWNECLRPALQRLMASPLVLKIAHNAGHDWTQLRNWGIDVRPPECDTGGVAAALNNAFPRNLAPALSTRFTTWPYHKWLVGESPATYCGYDTIVACDAYWQARVVEAEPKGLGKIIDHDIRLFRGLLEMQWRGVRIDEEARVSAAAEARAAFATAETSLKEIAEPIIRSRLPAFTKPHLFQESRRCACCGGGTAVRLHCWRCGDLPSKPKGKAAYAQLAEAGGLGKKWKIAEAASLLPACQTCASTGKTLHWLPFNVESGDQLKDVLYRGIGISPRKYKGSETIRAAQLEPLAGKHPFIDAALAVSAAKADYVTLDRLEPDLDGRVHSVFDPWGTASFRVSSSEGLLQRGSNLQNIPKEHRYVIVADDGYLLLAPDKAQIEARAVAVLSQDAGLLAAFTTPINWPGHAKHGVIDSHTYVEQVLSRQGIILRRDSCKRVTYAAIYGVSPDQLEIEVNAECSQKGWSERLKKGEGKKVLDTFFSAFSGLSQWRQDTARLLLAHRALVSPSGHKRVWPGYITERVKSDGVWKRILSSHVTKEGWSFLPQEMGAYVLAEGLENIRKNAKGLLTPLIHVHDELVLQVRAEDAEEGKKAVKENMDVTLWGMPFPTDVGEAARNWRCAKGGHEGNPCRFCGRP